MSAAPQVSVIIATYNMAQFLGEAIESVLQQTVRDLEVIVVDDGSTDATGEVMARYSSDPRVRYHRQSNAGQTRAKNAGIALAKGRLIAFCDADDLWTPTKLERQLPLFDAEGKVAVVYGKNRRISLSGEPMGAESEGDFRSGKVTEALFQYNFISFGTAVVRRSCLDEFGGFNEVYRMGIDWDLWLRISTRYEIAFLDEVVYLYRVWPGQMSNNWRGRYEHAFRIMQSFLEKYPNAVDRRIVQRAYAHSYTERARLRATIDAQYREAFGDAFTALRYAPTFLPAWKIFLRVAAIAMGGKAHARSNPT